MTRHHRRRSSRQEMLGLTAMRRRCRLANAMTICGASHPRSGSSRKISDALWRMAHCGRAVGDGTETVHRVRHTHATILISASLQQTLFVAEKERGIQRGSPVQQASAGRMENRRLMAREHLMALIALEIVDESSLLPKPSLALPRADIDVHGRRQRTHAAEERQRPAIKGRVAEESLDAQDAAG